MKKIILVALAILAWPRPAPAYVDHFGLYTLRFVIEQSTEIVVLRVLKDPSDFVSARCARSLFRLGSEAKRAERVLLELLKEPNRDFWEARSCAAVALGSVPGDLGPEARSSTGVLREASQDKDREVAEAATQARRKIESAAPRKP